MIIEVGIKAGGKTGQVVFDDVANVLRVSHPVKSVRDKVRKYLTTKRIFKIPESDSFDDYREDVALPTDEQTYFRLALCELFTYEGVWVVW